MEARKEELEIRIAEEKLEKPKIPADFMRFWLHKFRQLDMATEKHRQMLVDTFVNAIFVYDDKLLLTFNFKDGTKTITLADTETIANENGSDLEMFGVPKFPDAPLGCLEFFIHQGTRKGGASGHTGVKIESWRAIFSPWESPSNCRRIRNGCGCNLNWLRPQSC